MSKPVWRMPWALCVVAIGGALGCPDASSGSRHDTSTAADSDGHELPQCAASADEPACTAMPGCAWEADVGCVVDCEGLTNPLSCETLDYCYWKPDQGGCVWGIA